MGHTLIGNKAFLNKGVDEEGNPSSEKVDKKFASHGAAVRHFTDINDKLAAEKLVVSERLEAEKLEAEKKAFEESEKQKKKLKSGQKIKDEHVTRRNSEESP